MGSERVEIITRAERRRRWSMADKLRLVAATRQPGATVAGVAREHGVSESLLYHWRGRLAATASAGLGGGSRASDFIPVCVVDGRPSAVTLASDAAMPAATIEIGLVLDLNARPMRRLGVSRRDLFLELDRPALKPLPEAVYDYAEWRLSRVGLDYHVDIGARSYGSIQSILKNGLDRRSGSQVELVLADHPNLRGPR